MLIAQAPVPPVVTAMPAAAEQISCPAITQMLRRGAENPLADVSNLQRILRDIEGFSVPVTGDFDEATEAAVVDFQKRYSSEILGPWGTPPPTGIVSLTTGKKLNQIACAVPLTLSDEELRFIGVVREKAEQAVATGLDPNSMYSTLIPGSAAGPSAPAAYPYGDYMSASVGGSVADRFGRYLRGLFR